MVKLIVKSPYVKGKAGEYLKYIGTRDGVEMLKQQAGGYAAYMARRPHSHGLFGDEDSVNMAAAIKELNEYTGNIWTHIISLRREDAERLGYDNAKAWRNLLRAHRNEIAAAMRIPPKDFRWYAAFHDEGEHPHVHMMAWSRIEGRHISPKAALRKSSRCSPTIFSNRKCSICMNRNPRPEMIWCGSLGKLCVTW